MRKIILGITVPESKIFLSGQIGYFSKKGYQMYLMSAYDDEIEDFCAKEGCVYLRVNTVRDVSLFKDIIALLTIFFYFIKIRPDIVNVGTPKMGFWGMIAARLALIKNRIFTCHGLVSEKKAGLYASGFLKLIDRLPGFFAEKVICVSPSIRDARERLFGEKKGIVIGKGSCNGFDFSCFSPGNISNAEKEILKSKLSIKDKFIFGFVGRLVDEKGIKELYTAFSFLYSKNENVQLLLVGPIESVFVNDKNIIDKIRSHPGIVMMGIQRNIPIYLSVMNVFVLPAWSEGFGNVLVEAAAMGVPIISTAVTGCKDAVCDGFNGILISPKNADQLYEKMLLLYTDNVLRETLGRNGLEWAQNFRQEIIWKGLEQLYESL
jgi:glycosyltransferase involved in cell wall biosynthesis